MRLQIYLNVQVDLPYNLINMYINVSLRDTSLGVKIQNRKRHDFLCLTKKNGLSRRTSLARFMYFASVVNI